MTYLPKEIWMQQSYDSNHYDTWCNDLIHEDDVKYIRADIVPQQQLIKSAPHNKTVLVYGTLLMQSFGGDFEDDEKGWYQALHDGEEWVLLLPSNEAVYEIVNPTHWMPLPEIPTEDAE